MKKFTTWVEISREALAHNIKEFKNLLTDNTLLSVCVKSNAYGHGLVDAAKTFIEAGADFLSVNAIYEAEILRSAGISSPIYIMGYVPTSELGRVVDLDARIVVYNKDTISKLGEITDRLKKEVNVHIKVETGNNRQGVRLDDLADFAKHISQFKFIRIEGLSTHFANIEDTTDHSFAMSQVEKFKKADEILKECGINVPIKHCANSAATILFPETHFDMVRVGISAYGMWPSTETFVSYKGSSGGSGVADMTGVSGTFGFANLSGSAGRKNITLKPALCWKSVVAQVKTVPKGEYIGYGCTCRAARDTSMAIIPVGYYDGYDRGLSNNAHVLIHGQRAKILGRVCMNIIMADISDISDVSIEDEVVLIGDQKSNDFSDTITPEQFAGWIGSINYEVVTRINERIPRIYE